MARNYTQRNLIDFQKAFRDEEACAKHIVEQKWPDGFICPSCKYSDAWYLSKRKLFDCKYCSVQSEICYRFNRRFLEKELFDRLVHACVSSGTITYGDLVSTRKY